MFKKFTVSPKILPKSPKMNIPFYGLSLLNIFYQSSLPVITEVELTKTKLTKNSAPHFPWEDNGKKECQDFNNTIKL